MLLHDQRDDQERRRQEPPIGPHSQVQNASVTNTASAFNASLRPTIIGTIARGADAGPLLGDLASARYALERVGEAYRSAGYEGVTGTPDFARDVS